jgi:hypothetical protein
MTESEVPDQNYSRDQHDLVGAIEDGGFYHPIDYKDVFERMQERVLCNPRSLEPNVFIELYLVCFTELASERIRDMLIDAKKKVRVTDYGDD